MNIWKSHCKLLCRLNSAKYTIKRQKYEFSSTANPVFWFLNNFLYFQNVLGSAGQSENNQCFFVLHLTIIKKPFGRILFYKRLNLWNSRKKVSFNNFSCSKIALCHQPHDYIVKFCREFYFRTLWLIVIFVFIIYIQGVHRWS